jgi:epoxyqueuosine reductase
MDGPAIEFAHLARGVQGAGGRLHGGHYTGRRPPPRGDPQRTLDPAALAAQVKAWGLELGFRKVGIAAVELPDDEQRLLAWLAADRHGEMNYMRRHGTRRARPAELVPGTLRVISARMDYLPAGADPQTVLASPALAYVSRYAVGRDYHRVVRSRLARLAARLARAAGGTGYRAFTDSAPVLEKALAREAGLGWIGKHTNLLDRHDGSWFFLGEIFTDLPLPVDAPVTSHCGSCTACIEVCPTRAIVAPYQLDARRCISYLTIELDGAIPEEFRAAIGNRIYGCDDCQLVCPWNRYAQVTAESDFNPRHGLDRARLVELFAWTESEFLERMAGSAIRRIGHLRWLRNIAIALGNAPATDDVVTALERRRNDPQAVVRESVGWALEKKRIQLEKKGGGTAG